MIILDEESPFERIMKASKKHIQNSEKEENVQAITSAIGERRMRDLLDSLGKTESSFGWPTAVEYLIESSNKEYPVPVGYETSSKPLESLKFREVIFDLFDCPGMEPVCLATNALLEELSNSDSYISAKSKFRELIHTATGESLENGDTLFFETEFPSTLYSDHEILKKVEASQLNAIKEVNLSFQDERIHLRPLWYLEHSRKALAELGIQDSSIDPELFAIVISVLQVPLEIKQQIKQSLGATSIMNEPVQPMNPEYQYLLESIINCDVENLRKLGSRHAFPTFSYLLKTYADRYRSSESSTDYRNLLLAIRDHISIRWNDSIIAIADLTQISDNRITTDAISALGNFYHESAASTLTEIFCKSTDKSNRRLILKTIAHLATRCPETKESVRHALSQDCMNDGELRKFYGKTWKI